MYQFMLGLQKFFLDDFPGGPKFFKLAWIINFQKALTAFFVYYLMVSYDNWSATAYTYLALHGSYGFIWLMKDLSFPDPSWQRKVTIGGALNSFLLVLGPYWVIAWLTISRQAELKHSLLCLSLIAIWHTLGVGLMMAADAQKFYTLKYRKGLITEGLHSRTRNPNYLGEIIIYSSYGLLASHLLAWGILLWVWLAVFLVNMIRKDKSLSRYPQWKDYCRKSSLLIPKFW